MSPSRPRSRRRDAPTGTRGRRRAPRFRIGPPPLLTSVPRGPVMWVWVDRLGRILLNASLAATVLSSRAGRGPGLARPRLLGARLAGPALDRAPGPCPQALRHPPVHRATGPAPASGLRAGKPAGPGRPAPADGPGPGRAGSSRRAR